MKSRPLKILVLSSTRKERDGIAEYTRQVFRPEFQSSESVVISIEDINSGNVLAAPFRRPGILHIQHEFFLFDRLAGFSALFIYPYLWLWSKLLGFKMVTTIHSAYNVDDLAGALPHFRRFKWLFPLGSRYLRLHLNLVCALSRRIFVLTQVGMENLRHAVSPRTMDRKVRYVHHGNFVLHVQMRQHGILKNRFNFTGAESLFVLFGFAFPTKGYEYAIEALDLLVNQRGRKNTRLVMVSGETSKASFPGGGQGNSYLGWLKQLAAERKLVSHVIFTGYLANDDPLLEEIFAEAFCFVYPYLERNFASGAISTTLATGKPVLVSNIKAFQEYEGLMSFKEKDSADLADQMVQLMDDPTLVARAAAITRHNAEKFDMRNIFAAHVAVYQELARPGS